MTIQADFHVVLNKTERFFTFVRKIQTYLSTPKIPVWYILEPVLQLMLHNIFSLHLPRQRHSSQGRVPGVGSGHLPGVQPTHFRAKKQPATVLIAELLYLVKQQQPCCSEQVAVKFFQTSVRNWRETRHLKLHFHSCSQRSEDCTMRHKRTVKAG